MSIAEKLRAAYQDDTDPLCWSAADELDRLRVENAGFLSEAAIWKSRAEEFCNEIARLRAELALCKPQPECDLDLMNIIGHIIMASNARRSAQIAIGELDDGEITRLQAAVQHERDAAEAYKAEADNLRKQLADAKPHNNNSTIQKVKL